LLALPPLFPNKEDDGSRGGVGTVEENVGAAPNTGCADGVPKGLLVLLLLLPNKSVGGSRGGGGTVEGNVVEPPNPVDMEEAAMILLSTLLSRGANENNEP
jgi:hypothetical protein